MEVRKEDGVRIPVKSVFRGPDVPVINQRRAYGECKRLTPHTRKEFREMGESAAEDSLRMADVSLRDDERFYFLSGGRYVVEFEVEELDEHAICFPRPAVSKKGVIMPSFVASGEIGAFTTIYVDKKLAIHESALLCVAFPV